MGPNISFFWHFLNFGSLVFLKLCPLFFYQIFIFSPHDSPSKTMKSVLFHLKSSFRSLDIQIFVIFPFPFHTFHIQKDEWKWNDL